jgi:hypothetical protein
MVELDVKFAAGHDVARQIRGPFVVGLDYFPAQN